LPCGICVRAPTVSAANPKTLLLEQRRLIHQFFTTIVSEARRIMEKTLEDILRWPGEALLPVLQHTQQQKQRVERQFTRLREMTDDEKQVRAQRRQINDSLESLEQQLRIAHKLEQRISDPSSELLQAEQAARAGKASMQ